MLDLLFQPYLRTGIHAEFTRAIADNVHANKRRRTTSVLATLAAESRAETMDATVHRIEGRSGDRLTDHPRRGDAAMRVAEATRAFLEKRRP